MEGGGGVECGWGGGKRTTKKKIPLKVAGEGTLAPKTPVSRKKKLPIGGISKKQEEGVSVGGN